MKGEKIDFINFEHAMNPLISDDSYFKSFIGVK